MTDDAVLYAVSTFYDLEDDEFSTVQDVPVLKNARRFVIFRCLSKTDAEDSVIINVEPVRFEKRDEGDGILINRGFNSVIEACVHMTRYELTKDPTYIEYIRHHFGLIQRCGR
jgi:hypothetical protein